MYVGLNGVVSTRRHRILDPRIGSAVRLPLTRSFLVSSRQWTIKIALEFKLLSSTAASLKGDRYETEWFEAIEISLSRSLRR
jgi:hypothetical protein